MTSETDVRGVLDRIVRRERGRLIAGLAARLGPSRIALAEDVAQDAILEALRGWTHSGLPDNPAAWLARVARNKAIDRLRREGRETAFEDKTEAQVEMADDTVHSADITDPELRLVTLCCHPSLTPGEQLAMALKLAGGFTARDVSAAFLASDAAIGQRLSRAKRKLAEAGTLAAPGSVFDLRTRLPAILKAVYLLFSLGYAPREGERLILEDVCREALRLAEQLAGHRAAGTPDAMALAALLAFQASRLDARTDQAGHAVLLKDQDRTRWDRDLIARGEAWLAAARHDGAPSAYHLEAAIAGAYASAPDWNSTDWRAINTLFSALCQIAPSPIVHINACVARAMAGDPDAALVQLDKIAVSPALERFGIIALARGEILACLGRNVEAAKALRLATSARYSSPVRDHLEERIAALS